MNPVVKKKKSTLCACTRKLPLKGITAIFGLMLPVVTMTVAKCKSEITVGSDEEGKEMSVASTSKTNLFFGGGGGCFIVAPLVHKVTD